MSEESSNLHTRHASELDTMQDQLQQSPLTIMTIADKKSSVLLSFEESPSSPLLIALIIIITSVKRQPKMV